MYYKENGFSYSKIVEFFKISYINIRWVLHPLQFMQPNIILLYPLMGLSIRWCHNRLERFLIHYNTFYQLYTLHSKIVISI